MIGLDTNVLVRYFTQDDTAQAARANALVDRLTDTQPGYVTTVALAETYWVLRRAYKYQPASVATALSGLLQAAEIVVEQPDPVRRALRRVDSGADFADALIAELGAEAGCQRTMTLDERAAKKAGMQLLT